MKKSKLKAFKIILRFMNCAKFFNKYINLTFQTAARGLGGVPGTAARGGRMGMPSSMGRIGTAAGGGGQDMARPMTAVRGAGYTSAGNRGMLKHK